VAAVFQFQHRIEFLPEDADDLLRAIPAAPGVFALRGEAENSEPYLTRTADLRRRLRRLLAPPEAVDEHGRPVLSKRLNLREKVRWIEYTRTGSEFESTLVLYCATRAAFGDAEARRRLRLHAPYFLRITAGALWLIASAPSPPAPPPSVTATPSSISSSCAAATKTCRSIPNTPAVPTAR